MKISQNIRIHPRTRLKQELLLLTNNRPIAKNKTKTRSHLQSKLSSHTPTGTHQPLSISIRLDQDDHLQRQERKKNAVSVHAL